MRYFAYGSNMDPEQMAHRCPGSRAVGPALLRGHRLSFTWDSSRWAGGVGTVLADPHGEVWGVLWDIDAADEAALDRYEDIANGTYVKTSLTVEAAGEPVEAMVYVASDEGYRMPSRRYMRALVSGAESHGLPDGYVAALRAVRPRR